MILLIEPNKAISKRLCDMLDKERIITVRAIPAALEMIVKFKNNFNIIITNIRILNNMLATGTLTRLCEKLYIEIPPILVLYRKGDEKIKEQIEQAYPEYVLLEYDKDDNSFPEKYLMAIQELYPDAHVSLNDANDVWLRGEEHEAFLDPQKWLVEQGFLEALGKTKFRKLTQEMEQMIPLMKRMLKTYEVDSAEESNNAADTVDYKQMYFDLKKKYDMLFEQLKDLTNFIDKKNP
jgi:hypothetical protein